jgi:methylmalonyl-CoA mutase C-terminal domain/subunit
VTPARVLLAKPGLDGHDRGVKVIARACRDAGFEVIYTGIRQSAASIAETAVQEDVDVVGLSVLSGAHMSATEDVVTELRARGAGDIPVLIGGTIPADDEDRLRGVGAAAVFGVSTPLERITGFIAEAVKAGDRAASAGAATTEEGER